MKEYNFMTFLLRNTKSGAIVWDVYEHINSKVEDMIITANIGSTHIELEPKKFFVYTVDPNSNKSHSVTYYYDDDTKKIKEEIFNIAFKDYIPLNEKNLEWAYEDIKSEIEEK